MPTALFVSPHLDDVAFSCGGTAISLARAGWRTVVVTAFTASVADPSGFALACQLDKGLDADIDYLALRRREDEVFAERAGVDALVWLDLAEAPHRGYRSPPELFGTYGRDDQVAGELRSALAAVLDAEQPDVVFAPQALGGHVDHRRTADAVLQLVRADVVRWYADLPYAIRQPAARPPVEAVARLPEAAIDITGVIDAKTWAATAYESQLGFQFGGPSECADTLRSHAEAEATRLATGTAAEVIRAATKCDPIEVTPPR